MGYRDENETLRARVGALEDELAEANATITRLRGEEDERGTSDAKRSWLLGTPLLFDREAELPFEVSEGGYEAIAALLQARLGIAVSQVGRTLTKPGVFTLSRTETGTRIRLTAGVAHLRPSVIAAPLMTALLPGLPILGVLTDAGAPLHALWVIPAIAAGALFGTRRFARRRAEKLLASYRGAFEAILDVAEEHALRSTEAPRVRVDTRDEAVEAVSVASAPAPEASRSRRDP